MIKVRQVSQWVQAVASGSARAVRACRLKYSLKLGELVFKQLLTKQYYNLLSY
mgnify:CR=1 FL=1